MRHILKVGPASQGDINALDYWYDLTGAAPENLTGDVQGLLAAQVDGCLGYATGGGRKRNFEQMVSLDFTKWFHARTVARALRLDGETIGFAVMGPPRRLWNLLAGRFEETAAAGGDTDHALVQLATMALGVAKIYLMAVRPSHRRRGHGGRLIRSLREHARSDGLLMVYGQYDDADRPYLRSFYESLGFDVLQQGEPLNLALAVGEDAYAAALPTETFFVWIP